MSRSHWAWAKGCELVGAAVRGARRLGRNGVLRERLGAKRPVGTASSIPTLTWIATAAVLIAAVEPAHAQASATRGAKPPIAHPVSLTPARLHHPHHTPTPFDQPSPPGQPGARAAARARSRLRRGARLPGRPDAPAPPRGPGGQPGGDRRALRPADRTGRHAVPGRAAAPRRRDRRPPNHRGARLGKPHARSRRWLCPRRVRAGPVVAAAPGPGRVPAPGRSTANTAPGPNEPSPGSRPPGASTSTGSPAPKP